MKEEIENKLNITLDKNSYSDRKLYGGFLYFFKKEIKQDHYFTLDNKLYLLEHNSINYNTSLTETGKYADSFKIPLERCKEFKIETSKNPYLSEVSILKLIDEIEYHLISSKNSLNKLKLKLNE